MIAYTYRFILSVAALLIGLFHCYGQNDMEHNIERSLLDYIYATRDEKLYVHTDRESYQPNDTIWLRAYLVNAATNNIVDYSRFIYVELVDRDNTIHWREKIGRNNPDSAFVGYFTIPEISQGEYFLRCYTFYMQNQDEDFIYRKRIRVVNPHDHGVVCKSSVRDLGPERGRLLILSFENRTGELYTNVEFKYRIPGDTPDDTLYTMNTGYNGVARIRLNNKAQHIWIKSTGNSLWEVERYLSIPSSTEYFDVQFFPEGGFLLGGTKQRIAFKAIREDGLAIPIKGVILDSLKREVCSFTSNELGMGVFELERVPFERLTAKCRPIKGRNSEQTFTLPKVMNYGYAVTLDSHKEEVVCTIISPSSTPHTLTDKSLLIHSRGIPLAILNAERMNKKSLDLSTAPEGIIHFILLDSVCNIVSDRLWFHRKNGRDNINIRVINSPQPRKRAYCTIELTGSDSLSSCGTFSVSVTNNGQTSNDVNQYGIESYLLLTSDLKGYIENPAYYFESDSEDRYLALDYLMMTQGWSRFNVEDILQAKSLPPRNYYLERGQFLSGHVKNFWGRNSKNANIVLLGSNGVARKVTTDSVGRFIENNIYYERGTTFVVQATSSLGRKSLELNVDMPEFKKVQHRVEPDGTLYDFEEFYARYGKNYIFADNGEKIQTLGTVKVSDEVDNRNQGYFRWLADLMEYEYYQRGKEDPEKYGHHTYNGTNKFEFDTIYNLHGADPTKNRVRIYDALAPMHLRQEQQTGQPRPIGYTLAPDIPWTRRLDIGGHLRGGDVNTVGHAVPVYGIIVPYVEINYNMQTLVPSAPQPYDAEFYEPKYNVSTEALREMIDEKATRFWCPVLQCNKEYPYTFTFPTADGAGNRSYTITIEGITENGTPIHKTFQYSL